MPTPSSSRPSPAMTLDPVAADAYRLGRWFAGARRAGLLAALTPEAWHTLSALLSFTSREGTRHFTLEQLALALGVSRSAAQARLEGLAAITWQHGPLLRIERNPARDVAGAQLAPMELLEQVTPPDVPTAGAASSGHSPSKDIAATSSAALPSALSAAGLNPGQIERLLECYSPECIQRQLDWLPARQARNPAALLLRAIEGDWAAPKAQGEGKEAP